jgi:hypothetical protein
MKRPQIFTRLSHEGVAFAGLLLLATFVYQNVLAVNINSQVVVGNSTPVVSAVTLNGGSAITLTANATTSITLNYTVTDNNGCGDVFYNGLVTSTVFRSGLGAACSASNLNCYITNATATNNCPNPTSTNTSANVTTTFLIYYFAQATDASSSFSSEAWQASVAVADQTGATHSATSSLVELNTLAAINVTTSSLNYGTVSANSDTGSTNQTATTTNAGNSTTTLQLHTTQTLTSGSNSIPTSSQRYSTSTFTFAGTSTALTASAVSVTGFLLTSPTSTNFVQRATYWGLSVPNGTATGTYTGVNVFSSLFQP